eukprot:Pgem_evm1s9233
MKHMDDYVLASILCEYLTENWSDHLLKIIESYSGRRGGLNFNADFYSRLQISQNKTEVLK